MRTVSAFAAGLLFGLGLLVSGMSDPAKVLGFLDLAGHWDPSLAFVMAGAVAVSALGTLAARRRGRPLLAPRLEIPTRRDLDLPLVAGAAIFGLGWGLAGLCPGPALTLLTVAPAQAATFVAAMIAGMLLVRLVPEPATDQDARRGGIRPEARGA
ncbi:MULTISPECIES: YeeE/YedE family protein [Methylobacterium]|uniref:YeeE/YedE family protein n=1 Tax=Methylobacterium TaxID=407 RepID=UPI001FEE9D5B|nr:MULTISPECIES: YeeE/YedE family protein [Methylobacterium]